MVSCRYQRWKFPTENWILALFKSICYQVADYLFNHLHKFHDKLETVEISKHKMSKMNISHLSLKTKVHHNSKHMGN